MGVQVVQKTLQSAGDVLCCPIHTLIVSAVRPETLDDSIGSVFLFSIRRARQEIHTLLWSHNQVEPLLASYEGNYARTTNILPPM